MTDKTCMGEVMIQFWLKSKMSELLNKQVNAQKRKPLPFGVHASSHKPTKKCAMKINKEKMKLLMEGSTL